MERLAEVTNTVSQSLLQTPQIFEGLTTVEFYKEFANSDPLPTKEIKSLFQERRRGFEASRRLAEGINSGRLAKEREEVKELSKAIDEGFKAEGKILEHNLRLVVSRATKLGRLYPHYQESGLTFADLLHEGIVGIHRAVQKFDLDREVTFATYAVPWIDKLISKAIYEKSLNTISLDEPIFEGEGAVTFLERINSQTPEPEKYVEKKLEIEKLMLAIAILSERERRVILWRFGKGNTLEEVGKILGCTKENVRLIQKSAIDSLRDILLEPGYVPEEPSPGYITV